MSKLLWTLVFFLVLNVHTSISFRGGTLRRYSWRLNGVSQLKRCSVQCLLATVTNGPIDEEPNQNRRISIINDIKDITYLKGSLVFAKTQDHISETSMREWEQSVDTMVVSLKALNDQSSILTAYSSILKLAATVELTALQISAFYVLANAVSDSLMKLHPTNAPITSLIDAMTDTHLSFIDVLLGKQKRDDDYDGSEETLADSQEYLCIQYAGLAQYTYNRISNSLGGAFDTSASTQEMRRNMWLAPVLARLQRRCVRFSSSAAEERIEELFAATFTKMLDKLKFDVSPRYTLAGTEEKSETAPTSTATDTATALVTADRHKSLPAWDLAHFVQKVLRNSVQVTADLAGLESRVCGVLRERLSARIRSLHRPMERIIEEENRSFLSEKKIKIVEDLLNVGHECLAAVWVLWQIRHNIVGVPNAEGAFVKDFLRPVSLYSLVDGTPLKSAMVMESVPKDLRADVLEALQSAVKAQLQPPDDDHDEEKKQEESGLLESVALLGAAVRHTAGEEFRALSTYNMDSDELPFSRDAIFITALSALLSSVLTAPTLHVELLYENLLAFVVLEETLGVREPRAAASKAFEVALKTSSTALLEHPGMVADATSQRELRHRVDAVERALGMLLRLPEGAGAECRMRAFQTAIDEMVSAGEHRGGRGLRDVQAVYPSMANILGLPASAAEEYVKPLGQTRFDKTVGEMLLNSDVAVSMPELGATFEEQVRSMAEALLISPQDAEDRTVILAGAVLSSLLQNALDQSRKMSTARVDSLIQKAYYMYKHPLLRRLQDKRGSGAGAGADIKEVGMQMAIARVGAGSVVDLMRVLEAARSRMAVMAQHGGTGGSKDDFGSTGWGTSSSSAGAVPVSEAAEIVAFIQSMQTFLLKEFTTGNYKKGFIAQ